MIVHLSNYLSNTTASKESPKQVNQPCVGAIINLDNKHNRSLSDKERVVAQRAIERTRLISW